MANEEVFPVRRRASVGLGWFLVFLSLMNLITVGLASMQLSFELLCVSGLLLGIAWFCIKRANNVNEIVVNDVGIRFLPVGEELRFSDVECIHVPGWAGRHDNPPGAFGSLRLETNTDTIRLIPGAFTRWRNGCQINIHGCDENLLLSALRRYIPDA